MLALRCGPRLLGLLSGPRSAPLLLSATRTCSDGGARGANSSSGNPLVYLDVGADGQPLGRVVLEVSCPWRTQAPTPMALSSLSAR
ncbi:peptidylprolyl isomerase F (cyclophilin F), isoform CRA_a [Mus musculus]|nr:peptidylprolyl isomerase F (cyclophilin F), isoform CRA_a [Mus musculus]